MSKETLLLGTGDSAGHPKSGQGIVPCLLGERAVNEQVSHGLRLLIVKQAWLDALFVQF
jgi:hypothetical protein